MAPSDGTGGNSVRGVISSLLSSDRLTLAFLAVVFGGSGGAALRNVIPPDPAITRPDPWTGTDARRSREEVDRKIESLHSQIEVVKGTLNAHLIRGEAGFQRLDDVTRRLRELEHGEP